MKVLLLTGIKEELQAISRRAFFRYNKELRCYESRLYSGLRAMSIGPGLRQKKELRKLLLDFKPEMIINAGLVGLIDEHDSLRIGSAVSPKTICSTEHKRRFNTASGQDTLISVKEPLFAPDEKLELKISHGALFCDMEAYPLLEFLEELRGGEAPELTTKILFARVIGDRPADYPLFKHEHLLRNLKNLPLPARVSSIISFPGGPGALFRLYFLKRRGLFSLANQVQSLLKEIFSSGK